MRCILIPLFLIASALSLRAAATHPNSPPTTNLSSPSTQLISDLLSFPLDAPDPQDARASVSLDHQRSRVILALWNQGDPAIAPLVRALDRPVNDPQRKHLVRALGGILTPAATAALIPFLTDKNDSVRTQAQGDYGRRAVRPDAQGGSDEILPTLAKLLPAEPVPFQRQGICTMLHYSVDPNPLYRTAPAQVIATSHAALLERLKNDPDANVRRDAACYLTDFGDNSGLEELKAAAIRIAQNPAFDDDAQNLMALDHLAPAIERATGQNFGHTPMNPMFSSGSAETRDGLRQGRFALAQSLADWAQKSTTQPAK